MKNLKLPKCLLKHKEFIQSLSTRMLRSVLILYDNKGRIKWSNWDLPEATQFTEKQLKRMNIKDILLPMEISNRDILDSDLYSLEKEHFTFRLKTNRSTKRIYSRLLGYESRYEPFGISGTGTRIQVAKNRFLLITIMNYYSFEKMLRADPSRLYLRVDRKQIVRLFSMAFFDLVNPHPGPILGESLKNFFNSKDWARVEKTRKTCINKLKQIQRASRGAWKKQYACNFNDPGVFRNFWKDAFTSWTTGRHGAVSRLRSDLGFLTFKKPVNHYDRDIMVKITYMGPLNNGICPYINGVPGAMDPKQNTPDTLGYLAVFSKNWLRFRCRNRILAWNLDERINEPGPHELTFKKIGGCLILELDGKKIFEHYQLNPIFSRELKYCGVMVHDTERIINFEIHNRISLLKHSEWFYKEPEIRLKNLPDRMYRMNAYPLQHTASPLNFYDVCLDDITELKEYQKKLEKTEREKSRYIERLEDDLEKARKIQQSIIPGELPEIKGLDIAAKFIPSGVVGGDLYDVIPLDGNLVAFLLFDVSGHGLDAAFIASMAKMAFANNIPRYGSPSEIMQAVNIELEKNIKTNHFVASILGILDLSKLRLDYCNCGHIPPLIYSKKSNRIDSLKIGSLPLGVTSEINIKVETLELQENDQLLFHTDGLNECMDRKKNMFGMSSLKKSFGKYLKYGAKMLVDRIENDRRRFTGDRPNEDDITILAIGVKNEKT
jgi:serine phosphatase RsbU (regulator of sigma subunit)